MSFNDDELLNWNRWRKLRISKHEDFKHQKDLMQGTSIPTIVLVSLAVPFAAIFSTYID